MNKLYLIRGVSGAGKSSLVKSLVEMGGGIMGVSNIESLSADDWMIKGGKYEFNKKRTGIVHMICVSQTEKKMKDGVAHLFVHNTFTKQSELKPYYDLAEEYDYQVFSMIVENRHRGESIHDVPEDSLKSQKENFQVKL